MKSRYGLISAHKAFARILMIVLLGVAPLAEAQSVEKLRATGDLGVII